MSKRAFSRSFDIPTIDPDKEDETMVITATEINKRWDDVAKNALDHVLRSAIKCPVIEKVVAKSGCDHSWTSYTGLSESFEFCKHCDEKR
jgi:hypothetical protein